MEYESSGTSLDIVYIAIYTINHEGRCAEMMTAKLFENGRSQAVRLLKQLGSFF